MYSYKKNFAPLIVLLIFVVASIVACDDKNKDNDEIVTKSPRQKYEFISPGTGFSGGGSTLVNDYLYVGTSSNIPTPNNFFYKFDLSLHKIWEFPIGDEQTSGSPSLDSYGNIYFITDSGRTFAHGPSVCLKLYSIDNNGALRWVKKIGGTTLLSGMKCLAIAEDNTIYAAGDTFFAYDIDGNVRWTYYNTYIMGGVNQAPIIDPTGNIYFSSYGKIFCIDKNGIEKWVYETGEASNCKSSPAFTLDYSSLIVAINTTIYSMATIDGSLQWKYTLNVNAEFRSTPAVDETGIIYIGSHGNGDDKDESTIYAIKADGSGIIWENNLGSDFYSSPSLGNDRVIYIGSEGHGNTEDKHNRLHAYSMSTGERLWSAELANDVTYGSTVLHTNGMLYITTAYIDGKEPSGIYGFQTDASGLLPNCGSPTFQLSNAHNGRR